MTPFCILDKLYMIVMRYGFHIALNLKLYIIFKLLLWATEKFQWIEVLASKPGGPLSLVPGTHTLEIENQLPQIIL